MPMPTVTGVGRTTPTSATGIPTWYVLLKEEGPDHNKSFEVSAMLDGQEIGRGIGRTKKSAEQRAAYRGILTIRKPQE